MLILSTDLKQGPGLSCTTVGVIVTVTLAVTGTSLGMGMSMGRGRRGYYYRPTTTIRQPGRYMGWRLDYYCSWSVL